MTEQSTGMKGEPANRDSMLDMMRERTENNQRILDSIRNLDAQGLESALNTSFGSTARFREGWDKIFNKE